MARIDNLNQFIHLTPEQRVAIAGDDNPIAVDPECAASYVLIRRELFDRISSLLYEDADLSDNALRTLLARSWSTNGWDDPKMDDYDRYDEVKQ